MDETQQMHVIPTDEEVELNNRGRYSYGSTTPSMSPCRTEANLDPILPSYVKPLADYFDGNLEIAAFQEASRLTRNIGAAVIKLESVAINRRLLNFQKLKSSGTDEERSTKRRKLCSSEQVLFSSSDIGDRLAPSEDSGALAAASYQEQESESIWYQVNRMQRMSMCLKNAQLAQDLFLQEMSDCLNDAAITGAAARLREDHD